ncbi:MAG: hypothetical protein ABUK20_14735, partial [Anaerolineales bacterium]
PLFSAGRSPALGGQACGARPQRGRRISLIIIPQPPQSIRNNDLDLPADIAAPILAQSRRRLFARRRSATPIISIVSYIFT